MLVKKDFVNKKIILHGTKEECTNCLAKVKKLVGDRMVVEDMADACFMDSRICIISLDTRTA